MKIPTISLVLAAALSTAGCATYNDGMDDDMAMDDMASDDMQQVGVTIVETVVDSPRHNTLEQLVTAAGLVDTLSGTGPFTVFAPSDDAFARVPQQTVSALTQPSNREMLRGVLTYHVVPGRITAADLTQQITAGGGTAMLTTVQGTQLTASIEGDNVKLTDATGAVAYVENADILNSNGIVHSINGVLMPGS
ncbi:MAG: fasciclin domain-containing protein [Erythrobacter sp.]